MNRKILNALKAAEEAKRAAEELVAEIRKGGDRVKSVEQSEALIRRILKIQEEIHQLEMDSAIVDVIRAATEAREKD